MRDFKVGDLVVNSYCITKNRIHEVLSVQKNSVTLVNLTESPEAEKWYTYSISTSTLTLATKLECYLQGIHASTFKP
jgi:hypothetical protein